MRVVAGLVFDEQDQVLLALREPHKPYGDQWEIPGGKLEEQEDHENALCRELKEELDIDVDPTDLRRVVGSSFGSHDRVYAVRTWRGEPKALAAQCLMWLPLNEDILGLNATPLTQLAFRHIIASSLE